jgi:multidrug efflux system membrane fusion protein
MPSRSDDTTPAEVRRRRTRAKGDAPVAPAEARSFDAASRQETVAANGAAPHDIITPDHTVSASDSHPDPQTMTASTGSSDGDADAAGPRADPEHTLFGRPPPPRRLTGGRVGMWIILAVAAVVVALLIGWGLTLLKPPSKGAGRPTVTVGVAKATTGNIPIILDALGTVTPVADVTVRTRIEGQLIRVDFHEGQIVRAGQTLAEVDPRPYMIALQQAQGALLKDQALLANAQIDLKRYQTLLKQDSIASQQVDTQAALVKQDQGTLVADQAAVAQAKLNLDYCRITAPVAGRVGLRHVDPGNIVQTGDANGVVTVTQISPIDVVFTLPEDDLPVVTKRLGAGAVLPVTAYDRSNTTQLAQGALIAVDNLIDTTTGTVKVKARFANVDGALFGSQFVNTRVLVDTLSNVVIVPTAAVRHGATGDFVYTVTADRMAHMRAVKVGPATGDSISIASGLADGETVVTSGGDRLKDKARVMLPGDKPRSGAGGGRRGGRRGGGGGGGGGGDGG